jgi:quercetin dioxygenase-like cupin family protein
MHHQIQLTIPRADSANFTGEAYAGIIGTAEEAVAVKLYYVRFEPEARTFWHAHLGTQILVVTEGRCVYQRSGEPVMEAAVGESVRFESGERHWHGAGDEAAEHIAINLEIRETNWFEEVMR